MIEIKDKELHRISLTAIIYKKTEKGFEYLITKRSPTKKAFPNKWVVPGGGLETDDYINVPADVNGQWYTRLKVL